MDKHQQLLKIFDGMQYVIAKHVIDTLSRSNIKYAIVKRCPLAYYKTGRVDTRCSNDIDILIARNDVSRLEIILKDNGFQSTHEIARDERILLLSGSHQLPPYIKKIGKLYSQIDVNFDLFWGEYAGERIDVGSFLEKTNELDVYGCQIKTLPLLETLIHLVLHHYKHLNSIYILTKGRAIRPLFFEDIVLLCQKYPDELSPAYVFEACSRYRICPYAFYMFYYAQEVYSNDFLSEYVNILRSAEGEALLDYYGLSDRERKKWEIPFMDRIDKDVSSLIYRNLTKDDIEKIERNQKLFS